MAGPTCSILTPSTNRLDSPADALIDLVAKRRKGESFWVDDTRPIGGDYVGAGRPFVLFWEPRDKGESRALREAVGWMPQNEFGLAAMTNGVDDHRVLAEMAIWLAEREAGVIDLGGPLPPASQIVEAVDSQMGQRTTPIAHLATPEALRTWLRSAEFRMVK